MKRAIIVSLMKIAKKFMNYLQDLISEWIGGLSLVAVEVNLAAEDGMLVAFPTHFGIGHDPTPDGLTN